MKRNTEHIYEKPENNNTGIQAQNEYARLDGIYEEIGDQTSANISSVGDTAVYCNTSKAVTCVMDEIGKTSQEIHPIYDNLQGDQCPQVQSSPRNYFRAKKLAIVVVLSLIILAVIIFGALWIFASDFDGPREYSTAKHNLYLYTIVKTVV